MDSTRTRPDDASGAGARPSRRWADAHVDAGGGPPAIADVEQFLALVAHELRTPLSVIVAAAETLDRLLDHEDVAPAEIRRISSVLRRHGRLAARLVDRVGLAHRVGQGTVEVQPRSLDLAALVAEIVDDIAAFVLPQRDVTVTAPGPLPVVADPAVIAEIVFNLLANADKYSLPDAAIEVGVERHVGTARVVVRDQGSGVAPGDTELIFQPYVRQGPRRGGVGLGLYVSRALARAHGGDLTVRPATRVGSEFVLDLPVELRPGPAPDPALAVPLDSAGSDRAP